MLWLGPDYLPRKISKLQTLGLQHNDISKAVILYCPLALSFDQGQTKNVRSTSHALSIEARRNSGVIEWLALRHRD